jgi:hypothetical protein
MASSPSPIALACHVIVEHSIHGVALGIVSLYLPALTPVRLGLCRDALKLGLQRAHLGGPPIKQPGRQSVKVSNWVAHLVFASRALRHRKSVRLRLLER